MKANAGNPSSMYFPGKARDARNAERATATRVRRNLSKPFIFDIMPFYSFWLSGVLRICVD